MVTLSGRLDMFTLSGSRKEDYNLPGGASKWMWDFLEKTSATLLSSSSLESHESDRNFIQFKTFRTINNREIPAIKRNLGKFYRKKLFSLLEAR